MIHTHYNFVLRGRAPEYSCESALLSTTHCTSQGIVTADMSIIVKTAAVKLKLLLTHSQSPQLLNSRREPTMYNGWKIPTPSSMARKFENVQH